MNSKERLDSYLSNKPVDRRPNLTIIGSVVTQYTGIDVETYCKDWKAMTEASVKCSEDLKLDFIQIAADLAREAEGLGSKVTYFKEKLPTVTGYALSDISEVSKLKPLKTTNVKRMYDLVQATAYAMELNKDIYPMTLCVGPATIAGNTRKVEEFLVDLFDDEEACQELINIATETIIDNIIELSKVGSKYIYIADPVASLLSPNQYRDFILPAHQKIYSKMTELGIGSRLHMCGDTTNILQYSCQSGAKIIDIDHAVDFNKALSIVDGKVILNGNIDPVADVYSATPEHTKAALIDKAKSINYAKAMFMPGCELPTLTKLDNVKAIHEALVEIGG